VCGAARLISFGAPEEVAEDDDLVTAMNVDEWGKRTAGKY
jgi:hypothetical protein